MDSNTATSVQATAAVLQFIASLILAGLTYYYAKQTRVQAQASHAAVEEMRQARETQARAYVTVELWPWDRNMKFFDMAIRNYGAAAARDIRIVFDQDIPFSGAGGKANALAILRDLPFLAPHDEALFFLGYDKTIGRGDAPKIWDGTAHFTDDLGAHEQRFRINVDDLSKLRSGFIYDEPDWAPPIRRGWGRTGPVPKPQVGMFKGSKGPS